MNPVHYSWWYTTGTVGCFGAAIAVGCVLKLDEVQMKHALNGAVSMAAGLKQAFRSDAMTKPLHAGRAAEAGVWPRSARNMALPVRNKCSTVSTVLAMR